MTEDSREGTQPEPPSWVGLLTLMVHGTDPEPTLRGAIRSWSREPERHVAYGWTAFAGDARPVLAGHRGGRAPQPDPASDEPAGGAPDEVPSIRVWRDGKRLRIEEPDGSVNLIVGEDTCWQFDREHDTPLASPARAVHYAGNGTELLTRRDPEAFTGTDFTRPTGPVGATTFLGRKAWTVELAPPSHKPHPIQLVIDAQTGIVLQQRNDGFGTVDEWTDFVVGNVLDPALFTWNGPARSEADLRAEHEAEHQADMARRRDWFTRHVTDQPLRVEVDLDALVHEYDEATGAFQARLGHHRIGMLARRPHSTEPWELGWGEVQHQWSTRRWDWALTFHDDTPTADSVEAFKRRLAATE